MTYAFQKRSLIYLPNEMMCELPELFLARLQAIAGMVSAEADGVQEHARVEHASDTPSRAFATFFEASTTLSELLKRELAALEELVDHAKTLSDSKPFIDAIECPPLQEPAE